MTVCPYVSVFPKHNLCAGLTLVSFRLKFFYALDDQAVSSSSSDISIIPKVIFIVVSQSFPAV